MGTYYTIVNHTKRERIDTARIARADYKLLGSAFGEAARLAGYAMHYRWCGDHVVVVNDGIGCAGEDDRCQSDYRDVTTELVAEFERDRPDGWGEAMRIEEESP